MYLFFLFSPKYYQAIDTVLHFVFYLLNKCLEFFPYWYIAEIPHSFFNSCKLVLTMDIL